MAHQTKLLAETWELPAWAVFFQTGVGKTAPTIHNAVKLWAENKLDAVVVVAPNGVHRNWVTDELPKHCAGAYRALDWHSTRAKIQDRELAAMLEPALSNAAWGSSGNTRVVPLLWFSITYDALLTPRGRDAVLKLVTGRRFMLVIDEGSRVKNPTAQRTKKVKALRRLAQYARLLNGTPTTNSPLDLYAQMQILDEHFWIKQGIGSWTAFQSRFAILKRIPIGGEDDRQADKGPTEVVGASAESVDAYEALGLDAVDVPTAPTIGRTIEVIVGYRDLDKLHQMIQPMSTRVTKEQAGLNLPAKMYQRIPFELAPEQRRIYDKLRTEFMVELEDGRVVTAAMSMVRILRLQQVACGYLPNPDDPEGEPILIPGATNPRLQHFLELGEDLGKQQAIVWCRFTHDVDRITRELGPAKCVRYDGPVSERDRGIALDRFRGDKAQFIVAKAASMGMGITLVNSAISIYYSNTFSLLERLQSEDRQHRIGQHNPVIYYDLVAERTVDDKIHKSLRENMEIARQVTGDDYRAWLE